MTDFLHDPGISAAGYIASSFNLFTNSQAAFDSLTNGSTVTTTAGGSAGNGEFNQVDFLSGQYGLVWFVVGDVGWTPTAGGNIFCWWLHSTDGGTTFENTNANTALPRPPDFVIPCEASAYAAGEVIYAIGNGPGGLVELPYDTVKVYAQNNTGATMGNTTTTHAQMFVGVVADKF